MSRVDSSVTADRHIDNVHNRHRQPKHALWTVSSKQCKTMELFVIFTLQ